MNTLQPSLQGPPARARLAASGFEYRTIAAAFIVATLIFGKPIVNGDGVQYYAYARSTVVDHDLYFADEYSEALPRFRSLAPPPAKTPRGFDNAYAPVGAAVVWMAPMLAVHTAMRLLAKAGVAVASDGYSDAYMFAVSLTSWLAMLFGVLLCLDLASRWFSPRVAVLAVLGGWLASPLFSNAYELPTFVHAIDFGVVGTLVYLTSTRGTRARWPEWLSIGLLFGWAMAIRPQNVTFAILPGAYCARLWVKRGVQQVENPPGDRAALWYSMVAALLGAFIGFLPQIAMNVSLFGRPFMVHSVYVGRLEWPPHVWRALFSSQQGLFSWTPLMFPAVAGMIAATSQPSRRLLASIGLIVLLMNIALISVLPYTPVLIGQRYLINCVPFFILGLGVCLEACGVERSRRATWLVGGVIAFAVLWNIGLDTLTIYGFIDRNGSFTATELIRKQIAIAPYHWIDHVRGLSVNQPSFSPLKELARGLQGDGAATLRATAAVAAIVLGSRLTALAVRTVAGGTDNTSVDVVGSRVFAALALAVPIAVAAAWLALGRPFHMS